MVKKILGTLGAKFFSAVVSFFTVIITTQFLGAEGRGTIGLVITSIAVITLFSSIIGGPTLVYLVPRTPLLQLIIPSFFWTLFICTLSVFVFKYTLIVPQEFIIHIFFLSFLNSLAFNNLTIFIGKENIKTSNILSFLQVAVLLIVFLFLLFVVQKQQPSSYFIGLYVAYVFTFIVSSVIVSQYIKEISLKNIFSSIREMLKYGLMAQFANIIQFLNYRMSYYVLDSYGNRANVGVYSVAVSLSEAIWLFGGSIAVVQYSKVANSSDHNYTSYLTLRLLKFAAAATTFMMVLVLLLPSSFYMMIFGNDFGGVPLLMLCLATGIIFFSVTIVLSSYFSGKGKYHICTIASGIGFVLTIIFNYLLIPKYGIEGAGIAASLSYTGTTVYLIFIFIKRTKFNLKDFFLNKDDIKFYFTELKKLYVRNSGSN